MPWNQAWKVLPSWRVLHRVARVYEMDAEDWGEPYDGWVEFTHIFGATCCGREGTLSMPGMISRMCMPRCAHCCRAAGVERGDGIPGNGGRSGPMDAWQVTEVRPLTVVAFIAAMRQGRRW
jgi:hypothetical protein